MLDIIAGPTGGKDECHPVLTAFIIPWDGADQLDSVRSHDGEYEKWERQRVSIAGRWEKVRRVQGYYEEGAIF